MFEGAIRRAACDGLGLGSSKLRVLGLGSPFSQYGS